MKKSALLKESRMRGTLLSRFFAILKCCWVGNYEPVTKGVSENVTLCLKLASVVCAWLAFLTFVSNGAYSEVMFDFCSKVNCENTFVLTRMLIPKKNRVSIYEYLFKEGVLVAKKDFFAPKHPEIDVPNLHVIKALTVSANSCAVRDKRTCFGLLVFYLAFLFSSVLKGRYLYCCHVQTWINLVFSCFYSS